MPPSSTRRCCLRPSEVWRRFCHLRCHTAPDTKNGSVCAFSSSLPGRTLFGTEGIDGKQVVRRIRMILCLFQSITPDQILSNLARPLCPGLSILSLSDLVRATADVAQSRAQNRDVRRGRAARCAKIFRVRIELGYVIIGCPFQGLEGQGSIPTSSMSLSFFSDFITLFINSTKQ